MKKAIVTFECDNCPNEGIPDPDTRKKDPLPKEWAEVEASWNGGLIFKLELCGGCMTAIGNALGARKVTDA